MAWKAAALAAMVAAALVASPGARAQVSGDSHRAARWILSAHDHRGQPFAIVDKRDAKLHVFDGSGRLVGSSTVLLGQTPGDSIAPEVGRHAAQGHVPVAERTTPAGRFVSQPGRNLAGESIVWVDYASAFAIHRLRPGASHAARVQRLATPTPADNRASLGCVVVPVDFYTRVVDAVLGHHRAVVYVLPESGRIEDMLDAM